MKLEPNKQGIWLREDKCFYYLETGPQKVVSETDRVRTILTQRGKKLYNSTAESMTNHSPYTVMTVAEAEKLQYTFVPIYLSELIKKMVEGAKQKSEGKGWS